MPLIARGRFPTSVFQLLGRDENSATFALGWTLEASPSFANLFVGTIARRRVASDNIYLRLQQPGKDKGFTDLELRCGDELHAVVEAKVGWQVPTAAQLRRYRSRLDDSGLPLSKLAMVSVSAASEAVARLWLPSEIGRVPVRHISWGVIRNIAKSAHKLASGLTEKLWLKELIIHLGEFAAMDRVRDNLVFVVSLGSTPMCEGGTHTWIDVVAKDGYYFHPVGNHWPSQPPNYIGFRYEGKLQSVHRIASFEILPDVSKKNAKWLPTSEDHFVYRLGPAMLPAGELAAGTKADTVKRSMRVWCAIDTLLSGEFSTLGAARDATRDRLQKAEAGKE